MNLLNRPSKPFTDDLRRMLGANSNPRTLKAFEQLFEAVPGDFNSLIVEIEALDVRVTQNEADIEELQDFVFKVIQFKSADYSILVSDSGVVADSSSSDLSIDFPEASLWVDQDKFVENAGTNTVSVEFFGTEQVSGVDVILISPNTPYPVANFKSNGPGLTLLGDRNGSDVTGAQYWETKFGDQLTTKFGEKLVFRV